MESLKKYDKIACAVVIAKGKNGVKKANNVHIGIIESII